MPLRVSGLFQQKKNSIARVTPKRLRRKPKRVDCFTCRDGKRYARQQAKKIILKSVFKRDSAKIWVIGCAQGQGIVLIL